MKKIPTVNRRAVSALALIVLCLAGRGSVAPREVQDGNPGRSDLPSEKIEKIVFASSRALDGSNAGNTNGVFNVWVMNTDGSNATPLTKLTAEGSDSYDPVWSSDGTKIAFYSSRALDGRDAANPGRAFNIWVMKADGSHATPLTKLTATHDTFTPVWSPDGTRIAFVSKRPLDGSDSPTGRIENIWIINADGSNARPLTRLTDKAGYVRSAGPAWSPDGRKIAFFSSRDLDGSDARNSSGPNLWVMEADGSNPTPLTRLAAATAFNPAWSPDGTKIAFHSSRALDGSDAPNSNVSNVWVVKADGRDARPLTKLKAARVLTSNPIWSPDGTRIAFFSNRGLDGGDSLNVNGIFNLWVMKADGSHAIPVTRLTADIQMYDAVWSPDGTRISFYSNWALDGSDTAMAGGNRNVWVVNADGSKASPLTRLTAADNREPQWLP